MGEYTRNSDLVSISVILDIIGIITDFLESGTGNKEVEYLDISFRNCLSE